MVDVMALLRPRREARAQSIESLAVRLAAGERIAPEAIEAALAETGASADDLQRRVNALERRAELLAILAAGRKADARIEAIDREIGKAHEMVVKAQGEHAAVCQRHEAELLELRRAGERAAVARDELLSPAILSPGDAARLAEAREAESRAVAAVAEARRKLPELRAYLADGQNRLAAAEEVARASRGDPDFAAQRDDAARAVEARMKRVSLAEKALPGLQAAAAEAARVVEALCDELRR